MRGTLRIYVAGTGNPIYDSAADPAEGAGADGVEGAGPDGVEGTGPDGVENAATDESIKEAFLDGERLYYDPAAGLVRCYVNLQRNVPEQCVASYETDPHATDDLLGEFRRAVESAVESQGWQVRTQAGGGQAIYDELGTGVEATPTWPLSTTRDVLGDLRGETFGAPDETAAARFVTHLDAELDGRTPVAVGYGVPRESHRDAVFVRADAPVAGVTAVAESHDRLQDGLYRERSRAAAAARDDLVDELETGGADPAAYSEIVAEALSAAGLAHHGLEIRPAAAERRTKNLGLGVALATFAVVVAVGGAGLASAGLLDGLGAKLSIAASPPAGLPGPASMPSWQVLLATVVVGFGSYVTWWQSRWSGGPFDVVDRETVERFRDRVDDLAALDLAVVDSSLQGELAALLRPVYADRPAPELAVEPVDSTPWYRQQGQVVSAVFGVFFAVVGLVVLVESAGLTESAWQRLVGWAFPLVGLLVAVNLARLLRFGYRQVSMALSGG